MSTTQINVTRFNLTSAKSFEAVVSSLHAVVRQPYISALRQAMNVTENYGDFETLIGGVVGSSGFMEFIRFDQGDVLRKKNAGSARQSIRMIIGNPVVMAQMVELVPDAGSYAPVTILVDERFDGVHVSYDEMSSLLAPYRSEQASAIARDLDMKIESLITSAAV
jgi:uncharacterized protein (DUF302 family)